MTPTILRRRGSLYLWILLGALAGAVLGMLRPHAGAELQPVAAGFIKAVRMLVTPIIFLTVAVGVADMSDLKRVGRIGAAAILYFEALTTVALVIGLCVANGFKPGAGMNVDPGSLNAGLVSGYVAKAHAESVAGFLFNLIPTSFAGAFVENDLLQVLVLALLFGFALGMAGPPARPILELLQGLMLVFFRIVGFVTRLAPVAAFGALAYTVGTFGVHTLASLLELLGCMAATCLVFVFGALAIIARWKGFRLRRVLGHIRDEVFIAVGTSSSETALPGLMMKLERAGCPRSVVGIVVPAGYSFNLDGTCIYLTLAAIFLAQATNTPLTLGGELRLLAVLLLTSKGAAGVAGSGFITLAATLAGTGRIPVASMALILGIDPFMSEMRVFTNLVGNTIATLVIARGDPAFDAPRAEALLGPAKRR